MGRAGDSKADRYRGQPLNMRLKGGHAEKNGQRERREQNDKIESDRDDGRNSK